MATLNPSPSWPRRKRFGTAHPSKKTLHDPEARMPTLSSGFPRVKPFASAGTRKAVMPRCPLGLSVIAKTSTTSAWGPLVM